MNFFRYGKERKKTRPPTGFWKKTGGNIKSNKENQN